MLTLNTYSHNCLSNGFSSFDWFAVCISYDTFCENSFRS